LRLSANDTAEWHHFGTNRPGRRRLRLCWR